ncbi:MAG: macrocin-O-methyltransferase [Inquilinus sp.]|nr:macrocin-O-methyltransferase [Inquilinus sp.]
MHPQRKPQDGAPAAPAAGPSPGIDDRYAELLRRHIDDPDVIHQLGVFARRMYLSKTLGHFEIYRQVADLPGDVVECGVFKGESLLNFARFMEILNPGDRGKAVIGFDHFRGLRDLTAADGTAAHVGNTEGGWNPADFAPTLMQLIDLFHADSFVPQKPRIRIVDGDIRETAPRFAEDNPGLRISLLHLDCDLYEPTLAALQAFYPRLVTGGIVLLDEYGLAEWPGESRAVEEYFDGHPPRIEKLGWLTAPGGWFVKE